MSDIYSQSDKTPLVAEDNSTDSGSHGGEFLFDEWNLSHDKGLIDDAARFDGKIIARMPNLGAEGLHKNIERPRFFSFWGQAFASALSLLHRNTSESSPPAVRPPQRFFQRIAVFGGVLLLCGIGIILLDSDKDESDAVFIPARSLRDMPGVSATEQPIVSATETAFSPVMPSEQTNSTGSTVDIAVPAADVAAVPGSGGNAPVPVRSGQTESVWTRPDADSYSPWGAAPKRPEHSPPPPSNFAAATTPAPVVSPPVSPTVSPTVSSESVVMTPMTPMSTSSMPVSPYERQLLALSDPPPNVPVYPPGNSYALSGNQAFPGQSVPGMASQQNVQRPVPPQNYPPRGGQMNIPPNAFHGQYDQYAPYAVPPNSAQSNVPIPSGASTLPPQNGYYQPPQPYSTGQPIQRPPGDFFSAPPMHRRY